MNPTPSSTSFGLSVRKKRRPAVACQQCRRRKIKCDRQSPCGPCSQASISPCTYSSDPRHSLTNAPFDGTDTRFSVFNSTPSPTVAATESLVRAGSEPDSPGPRVERQDPLDDGNRPDRAGSLTQHLKLRPLNSETVSGAFFKMRFYGQSHWMAFAHPPADIVAIMRAHESGGHSHNHGTFAKCKGVGRALKLQSSEAAAIQRPNQQSPRSLIPTRAISDLLVQAYLRTFQAVFGILFLPSFIDDYNVLWTDEEESVTEPFCILLLLVLCIGSSLSTQEAQITRETATQWLGMASAWLNSLQGKKRVTIDGVRIHCLFLLARQTRSIDADTWISSGSLVRRAMHVGLHIDPVYHPSSSTLLLAEVESRRRLWATVVELDLQSSMDCGALPFLDLNHYNCALPLNVHDGALTGRYGEGGASSVTAKPMSQFTPSSMQILLMETVTVRTKIAQFINGFSPQTSDQFSTALSLSTELAQSLKTCFDQIETYRMSSSPPAAFQIKLFHLLVHRFFLGLHHPFAIRAMTEQTYYFSRKQCLETCLSLFFDRLPNDDDFYHLRLSGSCAFHDVYTQAALFLCSELRAQYREAGPLSTSAGAILERGQILKAINQYLEVAMTRINGGELNIRGYVLISCLLAQAEAQQQQFSSAVVEERVLEALKKSLDTCYLLLKSQVHGPGPVDAMIEDEMMADGLDWLNWPQWGDIMGPEPGLDGAFLWE